jgi:hypothetical protein
LSGVAREPRYRDRPPTHPTTLGAQGREHLGVASRRQAERLWRPLSRRARRMARPARVDMRCRNPCRRERLRLFGWNVRFNPLAS